ncbi:MAG: winged helix-turn-helix domain-containing protein [Chloroflexota bacterium]
MAAQGFTDPRPRGRVDARHMRRVMDRVGVVQIDSVNVLARSHYLPFFARLGPYPTQLLDDLAYRRREFFEYWGHEASFLPTKHRPLFRFRMDGQQPGEWLRELMNEQPGYVDSVLEEVRTTGPLIHSDLEDAGERLGPWWGWGKGKMALEWLFSTGRLSVRCRRNWARVYDLSERVLPADALDAEAPPCEEAHRQLLLLAARHLGVGTAADLADYYRIRVPDARPRIRELVDAGRLLSARVEGWREPAYVHPEAKLPRRGVHARAILSPFDSLIWERARTERLFNFRYRLEIYTPAPRRVYGYYVLPFLMGEELTARVDLKADRAANVLRVRSAHLEDGQDAEMVAPELAEELRLMAHWLGLGSVTAAESGSLARGLRTALR